MYSFFLIEGACWSGSTKVEHVAIYNNLPAAESGVIDYIRSQGAFDLTTGTDQSLTLQV